MDIYDTIKVIEIGHSHIIGSYLDPKIKYANDIDVNETIYWFKSLDQLWNSIRDRILKIELIDNIYITDFKLGNINGHDIKWSITDIKRNYIIYNNKRYYAVDLLQSPSIIKLDLIIDQPNAPLLEVSDNYFFEFPNGSTTNPWADRDIPTSVQLDFYEQLDEGHYFKALKRLYTYWKKAKHSKDLMNKLIQFLNSPIGKLNRIVSILKTVNTFINNKFKKPSLSLIYKTIHIIQNELPAQYHKYIIPIYSLKSFRHIDSYIQKAIDVIKKDIDYDTYTFIHSYIYRYI